MKNSPHCLVLPFTLVKYNSVAYKRYKHAELTFFYIAPEMFTGTGYNEDVDWWSIGITFYECVYGTVCHHDEINQKKKAIFKNLLLKKIF